ncbi:MAG: NTP transferase domain-containing protein [Pseudomonadota bacterium]
MLGIILAGGRGSRLGPDAPPKPLVPINGVPLVCHVAELLQRAGGSQILIATGHRGSEVSEALGQHSNLETVDTGKDTPNGGRLHRLAPRVQGPSFLLAWCDALTDADLNQLENQRRSTGAEACLLAVHPPERFGRLNLEGSRVAGFTEKQSDPSRWINGGFFALSASVLSRLTPTTDLERDLFPTLALEGQLTALRHNGFWACMDNLHEARALEQALAAGGPLRRVKEPG